MEKYEACYHLCGDPDNVYRRVFLTDSTTRVEEMLVDEHGAGQVVIRSIQPVKPKRYVEKTCRSCWQMRQEVVTEPAQVHPAELDKNSHLWRMI